MSVRTQRRPTTDSARWFELEVPAIVAGLESSHGISATTAETAHELVERGAYQQALTLVLGEVF